MRIIGGKYGGRRFTPPGRMPHTRPTTDMAKEGLFNILQNAISLQGIKTLDLFAGTGAISYELASRGAADLTLVEKDARQVAFIQQTAAFLQLPHLKIQRTDVFSFLRQCSESFDLIFAGPPYRLPDLDQLPTLVFARPILKPGGWFVLEHTAAHQFDDAPHFIRKRNYGTTLFSIFVA
jgi:16S rRNA (guanine(966)-N(2))-methyltransferase RsmD